MHRDIAKGRDVIRIKDSAGADDKDESEDSDPLLHIIVFFLSGLEMAAFPNSNSRPS